MVEEWLEGVDAELRRRFKLAGRGSVARVQRALGLGRGYFREQRRKGRRGSLNLRVVLQALEVLEVPAVQFFAAVLGPGDPVAEFRNEAADLRLARRKRRAPRILGLEAQRPPGGGAPGVEVDLEALDRGRDDDPREVMRRIKQLILQVADAQVPELLAIYASASRGIGEIDEAHLILDRALELAGEVDDEALMGRLLQRCEAVAAARGQYEKALALTERAAILCAKDGDQIGIGQALLKMGMNYGCLERSDEAIQSFNAALSLLPGDQPGLRRLRFAALMNLGIVFRKRRELDAAERYAAKARAISESVGEWLLGKLVWLQGSIAKHRGDCQQAEKHYQQALEIYRRFSPLNAALLAVEVARVQVTLGDQRAAKATAKSTISMLTPLQENEVAAAAILELGRCALAARPISLRVLDKIGRQLMKSRARQGRRARQTGR